jgi:hypothetical protein
MDDPSHIIMPDKVELKENLSFEVPSMSIEDISEKYLRGKSLVDANLFTGFQ